MLKKLKLLNKNKTMSDKPCKPYKPYDSKNDSDVTSQLLIQFDDDEPQIVYDILNRDDVTITLKHPPKHPPKPPTDGVEFIYTDSSSVEFTSKNGKKFKLYIKEIK